MVKNNSLLTAFVYKDHLQTHLEAKVKPADIQNATPCSSIQSNGFTNLENVKKNGNNFATRYISLHCFLEFIRELFVFYLHGTKQDSRETRGYEDKHGEVANGAN